MVNIQFKLESRLNSVQDIDRQLDTLVKQGSVAEARALLAQLGPDVVRQFNSGTQGALSVLNGPLSNVSSEIRGVLARQANTLLSNTTVSALNAIRQKTNLGNFNLASPNDLATRILGKEDNRLTTSQPQREQQSGTANRSSADNIPIRDNAPLDVEPLENTGISENVLNDYINLQYHITLSLVPYGKLSGIQTEIPIAPSERGQPGADTLRRLIENDGSVVFASTGEISQTAAVILTAEEQFSREELAEIETSSFGDEEEIGDRLVDTTGKNYYNIKSVKFDTVMSPSKENPYMNQMLGIKMILIEPHGFKLYEDIRRLADELGYRGMTAARVVWRVDIGFSGYNQDTGEWVERIDLDTRSPRQTQTLTYYQNISKMQAKVDHTGTTYDIDMVPSGHIAYRPEEMTLKAKSIFAGAEGSNVAKVGTFGGFLKKLETAMKEAKDQRTHKQIKREYKFFAPTALLEAKFFEDNFASRHGFIGNNPDKGQVISGGRDINVINLVETALNDLELVWDRFLADQDPSFEKPRIHWGIRFNTRYVNSANSRIYDVDTIVLEYIIEPYATYKKASIENIIDARALVDPAAQLRRLEEMLRLGMVNRVYDYIHTSENTEVIDFDVTLKNFYYHSLFTYPDNPTRAGSQTTTDASSTGGKRKQEAFTGDRTGIEDTISVTNRRQEINTESALQRLFGSGIDNAPASCFINQNSNPYDILAGGFNEFPQDDYYGAIASSANQKKNKYHLQLNDHLRNDLLRIDNLQVRGDPIWLLTPYGVESGNTLATQKAAKDGTNRIGIVQTQASRLIYLRLFAPDQVDYMNPDREFASSSCNVIGGFYEVFRVTSTFEGGKFTQTITGAKINHLNFIENFISVARDEVRNGNGRVPPVSNERVTQNPPNAQPPKPVDLTGNELTTNQQNTLSTQQFFVGGN